MIDADRLPIVIGGGKSRQKYPARSLRIEAGVIPQPIANMRFGPPGTLGIGGSLIDLKSSEGIFGNLPKGRILALIIGPGLAGCRRGATSGMGRNEA